MNFNPSIQLVFSKDISNPIERVELNNGIEIIDDNESYLRGSVIPNPSFQTIDKISFEKLYSPTFSLNKSNKNFAGIINLDRLASPFFNLDIHHCKSADDVASITQTEKFTLAIKSLLQEINSYFIIEDEIKVLGVSIKQTSLQTVTVDRKINQRIGLHLDSWDKSQLNLRDNSRNRICINLGQEERYFVFVNKTVNELLDDLVLQPSEVKGGSDLGRLFLKKHPDQPITKLKVKPGEAYIAPTENIIHDGTTAGKTKPDIALTLLGNFWVRGEIINQECDKNWTTPLRSESRVFA